MMAIKQASVHSVNLNIQQVLNQNNYYVLNAIWTITLNYEHLAISQLRQHTFLCQLFNLGKHYYIYIAKKEDLIYLVVA